MSKLNLDEHGILTKEAWEAITVPLPESNIRLAILTAQRDAMIELFQEWIDEADKRHHYGDGGQEGIAYLYGQVAKLRANGKPPG